MSMQKIYLQKVNKESQGNTVACDSFVKKMQKMRDKKPNQCGMLELLLKRKNAIALSPDEKTKRKYITHKVNPENLKKILKHVKEEKILHPYSISGEVVCVEVIERG